MQLPSAKTENIPYDVVKKKKKNKNRKSLSVDNSTVNGMSNFGSKYSCSEPPSPCKFLSSDDMVISRNELSSRLRSMPISYDHISSASSSNSSRASSCNSVVLASPSHATSPYNCCCSSKLWDHNLHVNCNNGKLRYDLISTNGVHTDSHFVETCSANELSNDEEMFDRFIDSRYNLPAESTPKRKTGNKNPARNGLKNGPVRSSSCQMFTHNRPNSHCCSDNCYQVDIGHCCCSHNVCSGVGVRKR